MKNSVLLSVLFLATISANTSLFCSDADPAEEGGSWAPWAQLYALASWWNGGEEEADQAPQEPGTIDPLAEGEKQPSVSGSEAEQESEGIAAAAAPDDVMTGPLTEHATPPPSPSPAPAPAPAPEEDIIDPEQEKLRKAWNAIEDSNPAIWGAAAAVISRTEPQSDRRKRNRGKKTRAQIRLERRAALATSSSARLRSLQQN